MEQTLWTKAKNAESVEELLQLSKENNYPLTEEDAEALYEQLHTEGEVSDDELDAVAGGGCKTKVNGHKYTVVTHLLDCFNGKYEPGYSMKWGNGGGLVYDKCLNTDNVSLRHTWADLVPYQARVCGNCKHLKFKAGTGYCGLS